MADYKSGSVYGIVLLPDTGYAQRCIEASAQINELTPSLVVLNSKDSRAHITVVHIEGDAGSASALWSAISIGTAAADAESIALHLRPSEGMVWVGFEVRKTSALVALHDKVVDICKSQALTILSEHGDKYWPHITLGRWPAPLPQTAVCGRVATE